MGAMLHGVGGSVFAECKYAYGLNVLLANARLACFRPSHFDAVTNFDDLVATS